MKHEATGNHLWAGSCQAGDGDSFHAIDAATGLPFGPAYREASATQDDAAVACAVAATDGLEAAPTSTRSALLRAIAAGLESLGGQLVEVCQRETGLPEARIQMERGRTANQLRMFADVVEDGGWRDARIDTADPTRQPLPKPDLRAMLVPIGPVAVFGASNFPLAYSVAGGDTASALAAGCPVIVKGHPAHPQTSELVGSVIRDAVRETGLPAGTFGLVHGASEAIGRSLVEHPGIEAVGFTGSVRGGSALCRMAAERPRPIPVFAEMGSLNPVIVLPEMLQANAESVAKALVGSASLGVGQFCTCPGMVLHPSGGRGAAFTNALAVQMGDVAPGVMVHPSLRDSFERAVAEVGALQGVAVRATGRAPESAATAGVGTVLFTADVDAAVRHERLREEVFGPAMVAVAYDEVDDLSALVDAMPGYLTATVLGTVDDISRHRTLLSRLRRRVGRLLFRGVPTGVEVCSSMQHGGPWPASSDSRFTAVGSRAILRWARPVCYQDAPQSALPPELLDANPLRIPRTVDGVRQPAGG